VNWLRRPTWFAVALTVAGVLLFVRLGVWQLDRANQKDELLRLYAASTSAPLEPFAAVEDAPPQGRYPRVAVEGEFVADRYYLLDDQVHAGQVGVHVYAPFRPHGRDSLLLVDLGFLPKQGGGSATPPLPPLPTGERTVRGLYVPSPGVGVRMGGNALTGQRAWPKLAIYIDLKQIGDDLGTALYPRVLLIDPDPASIYTRDWTPGFMPPARHRAYAFQWFTFALAAVVIFLILHRRRRPKRTD
jgi:cytochrome oxidase assembly protein ShyY1